MNAPIVAPDVPACGDSLAALALGLCLVLLLFVLSFDLLLPRRRR